MRRGPRGRSQSGQAAVLLLGVIAALFVGTLVLAAFGQALGAKGRHQRAADLAAMSAARVMRTAYPRLFEPAFLRPGVHNPRHLSVGRYVSLARAAAVRATMRNGLRLDPRDVRFPEETFAPVRVSVTVRGRGEVRLPGGAGRAGRARFPVAARATAEFVPAGAALAALPTHASGGGYEGPLAYRMGKPMRPDVAIAFDRMAAAAARAGVQLSVTSGYRSDAEQARLFAANPNPRWVAPPGTSLHRYGTELDLGPPAAYGWLAANAGRFGFIKRYSWEPWHFGFGADPRDDRPGAARHDPSSWEPPGGDHGPSGRGMPGFVPPRFHDEIARASLRWNVSMNVLAAQLYAESGFNPFARSPAGAQGIAQFMPGTARAYGLADPYDPAAAIDAQAHLMSDLLKRFGGKLALALAAYNAGPGAVESHGGIPPYAETRAYVTKILGLLGGAGDLPPAAGFEVRLVE
ncbi:MAG TPA: transglycosylase SLT domain-containing protein [Thermoleophilaceae bacterium]|nr:transglycosylase SLT domain-containing protein [Thermoleophilaceae bacterium]